MEKILSYVNYLLEKLDLNNEITNKLDTIIVIILIALIALISDIICKNILLNIIKSIIKKTKNKWDDLLLDKNLLGKLVQIVPVIIIYILIPLAFKDESYILIWTKKICYIFIIAILLRFISGIFNIIVEITDKRDNFKEIGRASCRERVCRHV